jgi:hypothetical protein
MSKPIVPNPRNATTMLAIATDAPRSFANSGMTGMTAPWPTANRKVGR